MFRGDRGSMPNDAKLGLVVGVGVVIAIAVVFTRKDPAAARPQPADVAAAAAPSSPKSAPARPADSPRKGQPPPARPADSPRKDQPPPVPEPDTPGPSTIERSDPVPADPLRDGATNSSNQPATPAGLGEEMPRPAATPATEVGVPAPMESTPRAEPATEKIVIPEAGKAAAPQSP